MIVGLWGRAPKSFLPRNYYKSLWGISHRVADIPGISPEWAHAAWNEARVRVDSSLSFYHPPAIALFLFAPHGEP